MHGSEKFEFKNIPRHFFATRDTPDWTHAFETASTMPIHPSSVLCENVEIIGNLENLDIDQDCIFHPKCKLVLHPGQHLRIGRGNVVEEHTVFETALDSDLDIGHRNLFQVGSVISGAKSIGHHNVFQVKTVLEAGVEVGDHCRIGPTVRLARGSKLTSNTVVSKVQRGSRVETLERQQQAFCLENHQALMDTYQEIFRSPDSRWLMGKFHSIRKADEPPI